MIRLKFIGFFVVLLAILSGFSQETFIKSYGNTGYDYARDIKQDNDSGYVITGSSSSFGPDNAEAYLLKLDKSGNFLWSHNYGGEGTEWGESMLTTHDSTYAIAGYTNSFGAGGFDFYLVRIGADGAPLWENYYGGSDWDQAYGLVQLPDSGFILVGDSYSFNGGVRSGYMVRTDKNGELVWEIPMLEDMPSFLTDISLDGDSIIVCGGIGDGGVETFDGLAAKYHIDGGFGWKKIIGREYNDYFNAVEAMGGFYSFGGARSYRYPTEKENMWMYRMDDVGNEIVDTVYVNFSPEFDQINDISIRDDQDYAFIGETSSFGYATIDGQRDIFMGKMNIFFEHIAANNYGEAGEDIGRALDRTRDLGAVYVCDTKLFSTGGNNILVIKVPESWEYPDLFDLEGTTLIVYDDITTGMDEYIQSGDFNVYPNPFEQHLNLPLVTDGLYSIHTIDGQCILENSPVTPQLDLGYLETGVYLLTVKTENGIFQQRIIKNSY